MHYLVIVAIEVTAVFDEYFDVFDKISLEVWLDVDEMCGDLG